MKKYLILITIMLMFLGVGVVNAASPASTSVYFKTGRESGVFATKSSEVKVDQAISSDYNFSLGNKYQSYSTGGSAGSLTTAQINAWDSAKNTSHKCTDQSKNPSVNCSDTFWNMTYLDYSRVDGSYAVNTKGKFYALYKNVGTYNGTSVDVKLTIVDFSVSTLDTYKSKVPVVGFYGSDKGKNNLKYPDEGVDRIGIWVAGVEWVQVKYDFYKSGTSTPITVKGYTTYWDVDGWQGVHLLDNYDDIFVASDTKISYVKINGAPYLYDGNLSSGTRQTLYGYDANGAFTETFTGSSINRVYSFIATKSGLTASDYKKPTMAQSSGGIWNSAVVNGGIKTYNDNTPAGKDGASVKVGDTITYDIQFTNGDSSKSVKVKIVDTLSKGLKFVTGSAKVNNSSVTPTVTNNSNGTTTITWTGTIAASSSGTLTYSATVTNDALTVVNNQAVVTIGSHEYTLAKLTNNVTRIGTVIVRHLEEGTNKELATQEQFSKNYGDSYTTSAKNIANYNFDSSSNNTSGTITKDTTEVFYYYKLKDAKVITKHLEKGTNKELASPVTKDYHYGDTYTTSEAKVGDNYNLDSISGSASGLVNKDSIEVIYYYVKKDTDITDNIVKTGTDEITSSKAKVEYKINYTATIKDYIGDVNIVITDNLPYSIDASNSELDGGKYNSTNKTITWTESIKNYNSYNDSAINITKNVKLSFTNIDPKIDKMINEVTGTIKLSDKESSIKNTKETKVKIPGTVTVKYVDTTGKEIATIDVKSGFVGETVSINEKDIEGYNLITKPKSEVIEIVEGNTECVYVYEKIKYNIITKALNKGGIIYGDEIVEYGKDAKNIVTIEADDGYYIKMVRVNNKEINVKENATKMSLPRFTNLKENKLVEVEIATVKMVYKAPSTGSPLSAAIIVAGSLLLLTGVYFILKKYKIIKF